MDRTALSSQKIMAMVKGLLFSYLITGLSLVLLALLLFKFQLDEGKVTIGIIGIYILSCFLGGFFVGKKNRTQKFVWGFLLGFSYFVLLVAVSALTEPGLSSGLKGLVTSCCMCVGAGTLGGMVS